ncbi:MAG: hypothetical protein ACREAA_10645 [Candidatus Polarisedimenticolia bacterium]
MAHKRYRAMLDVQVRTGGDGVAFVITPTASDMGARLTPVTTEAMRKTIAASLVMASALMDILEDKGNPKALAAMALEAAGARLTKKRG